MDKRLEEIFEFTHYRDTLTNQIMLAKDKGLAELTLFHNGGSFVVNRELISFVFSVSQLRPVETLVLLDVNDHPIKVNLKEFLDELLDIYFRVTNSYHEEYEKLKQSRDVKSILDLTDEQ
jgi:hypothetical protein